jgi:O-methyltransferase
MISPDLRTLYLDLLEKSLLDLIYGERPPERRLRALWQRLRHPYITRRGSLLVPMRAHTMIGPARLRHLRCLVERTIQENVPGDYIETGVWRGGACILMRGVLAAHGIADRRVYCADTFTGLPRPESNFPADKRDRLHAFRDLAVSEETVRRNFAAYNLLDDKVVFLKGLFADTLPKLSNKTFALIRLDGDMYGSTMSALVNLYDRVSSLGFVIIDDYGGRRNCAKAVHDFVDQRELRVRIQPVDESCVWWQKE